MSKPVLTNTHKVLLGMAFLLLVVVAVVASNVAHRNARISRVEAVIDYGGGDTLVAASSIVETLQQQMPTLVGTKVKDFPHEAVSRIVEDSPYISQCDVQLSVSSTVLLQLKQRVPIIHLFTSHGECYIDHEGRAMPTNPRYMADVLVANGRIADTLPSPISSLDLNTLETDSTQSSDIYKLWYVARYLYDTPLYGQLFDQLYLRADGDMLLVPRVGNHIVLLGDTSSLDNKLQRLHGLYTAGLSRVGWDTYKQINLKYDRQVVCTRR